VSELTGRRPAWVEPVRAPSRSRLPARLGCLLAGAGLVALGAGHLADHRACERATAQAFVIGSRGAPAEDPRVVTREILGRCRGARRLTPASEALGGAGHLAESAVLAREATRREPQWWLSWRAQAAVLERRGDRAGARQARARARALNPR
jgi:hypothetical protein